LPEVLTVIEGAVEPFDQTYVEAPVAVKVTEPPEQNVVAPFAVAVTTGSTLTVTGIAADVAVHPLASVTVSAYEPGVVATYVLLDAPAIAAAPLFQAYVKFEFNGAMRVTDPPVQNVVAPTFAIETAGRALTVTTTGAEVAEHPFAFVIVTEYEPVVVAVIAWVDSPVDQA
jgi:hypothetical protein